VATIDERLSADEESHDRASGLLLGTSSWTAPSWEGPFYPKGTPASEYLRIYAKRFNTVEIDSTWYRTPSPRTVDGWNSKTPPGFVFVAKVPQSITHEKILLDCDAEVEEFLGVMGRLGRKLGPVLFQFPYFRRDVFNGADAFLERLVRFLATLPTGPRYAVEVRNRGWVAPPLLDLLRRHQIALALIDHPWMPRPSDYARIPGIVTTDFLYVRWLGDRHGIEEITTAWDRLILDRTREMEEWANVLRGMNKRADRIYAYYNNHYAGCGYQSAQLFLDLWQSK
jgi:uncharacterized protein YecE (DUF72 family)